jgi:hypothetical protein
LQSRVQGANVLYEKSVGRTADAQEHICRTRVQERGCEPNNSGKHLDLLLGETTKERWHELCQEAAAGKAPKSRTFSRRKATDFCKKKVNVPIIAAQNTVCDGVPTI